MAEHEFRNGDVLAFDRVSVTRDKRDRLTDTVGRQITGYPAIHIGMVLVENGAAMSVESHYRKIPGSAHRRGVQVVSLKDRLETTGGVWHLALPEETLRSSRLKMRDFLVASFGTPYDMRQAAKSWIDFLDAQGITLNEEDSGRLFCSELVAFALRVGRIATPQNCSEVSVKDLCEAAIYRSSTQIQIGDQGEMELPGFNTRELK